MGRFMYQHFGDGVPRRIEVEYNKMLRHEQYLEERDAEYLAQSVSYEDVQDVIADPASLPINSIEAKNQADTMLGLPFCLSPLKCSDAIIPKAIGLSLTIITAIKRSRCYIWRRNTVLR